MRKYQIAAIHAIQRAAAEERDRFLFEMATGTGKTLVSAGVIRLFLRTGNARCVLFLVDRIELEEQAWKNFNADLKNDFDTVIYKEHRDDWRKAHIVVSRYDCPDILNLCLMRPIFSPTDFIQIKGRGTRKHNFTEQMIDPARKEALGAIQKERFKLFDFFANYQYFEEDFNYDEVLELPKPGAQYDEVREPTPRYGDEYTSKADDKIITINQQEIGDEGMKIDWMFFERFKNDRKNIRPCPVF